MEIRKYCKNDFSDLVSCVEKLQDYIISIDNLWINIRKQDYGIDYVNRLIKLVKGKQGIIYLVYNDKVPVWCMVGIIEYSDENDSFEIIPLKIGRVQELYVDDKCRWKWIWKQLMKIAEDYFLEQSCNIIKLEVFAPNKLAKDFYYKLDFNDRMVDLCKVLKL